MTALQAGNEGGTPRRGAVAAAGVGLGIIAGALAKSRSEHYGEDGSGALRITAHATIPFFVLANALTDRVGHMPRPCSVADFSVLISSTCTPSRG
jgi:hypothetical protein